MNLESTFQKTFSFEENEDMPKKSWNFQPGEIVHIAHRESAGENTMACYLIICTGLT
jgi:hypothetical protein